MEKVVERFKIAEKSLNALKEAIDIYDSSTDERYIKHLRNSKIQSFEFSIDTLWKFLKIYFQRVFGADIKASPKAIFRYCLQFSFTNEDETKKLLEMVDDRNISSHTYHEGLAEQLNKRIEEHYRLMKKILDSADKESSLRKF